MRTLVFASFLALGCSLAHAADNGFYLGAGVIQTKLDDVELIGSDVDIDDTSWKVIAGFRPIDLLAVEATYMDLGSESIDLGGLGAAEAEAKAFSAYALGFLPIPLPFLDIYGKVGLARWEVEGRTESPLPLFTLDEKGTDFAYGAGAQVSFGSLAARLEVERFDIEDTDGLYLYTLGLTWTFL